MSRYRLVLGAVGLWAWFDSPAFFIRGAILRVGTPLSWQSSRPHLQSVRLSGAKQFLNHYLRSKCIETPLFLWGDEIEYGIFDKTRHLDLSLRGTEIREHLTLLETAATTTTTTTTPSSFGCQWQPEYGSWMVEAVPRDPYSGYVSDLLNVEKSMQWRRKRLHAALKPSEIAPSVSNFPMLGVQGYGYAHTLGLRGPVANSALLGDDVINPHPRMQALTKNIRLRRGSNVSIRLPLEQQQSPTSPAANSSSQFLDLDAMAFGMGCCCLQVTMQCKTDAESRFLHDQLVTFSPLLLALSAATPAFQGRLLSTDTRWQAISDAVDDRTPAERGNPRDPRSMHGVDSDPCLVANGARFLPKSRYSSTSRYISQPATLEEANALEALNDVEAGIDDEVLQMLVQGGMDCNLAMHVAHLFTRDPLVIFDDAISLDDTKSLDHFENIQSTNWRTMRWKPPCLAMGLAEGTGEHGMHKLASPDELQALGPGWRVEFRPLELQLTDFENAAYSLLSVLISRSILRMGYNFYLPMSLVEENMRRAQQQNAAVEQKFWIRREALNPLPFSAYAVPLGASDDQFVELSLDHIFNGGSGFQGLLPAIVGYLESLGCSRLTIAQLKSYLGLVGARANGSIPTTAQWLRQQYKSHPDYRGDGKLSPRMVDEVLTLCDDIGMGKKTDYLREFMAERGAHSQVVGENVFLSGSEASFSPSYAPDDRCKKAWIKSGEHVDLL